MGVGGAAPYENYAFVGTILALAKHIGFTLWSWPLWSVVCGMWSVACGWWSVVCGRWSVVWCWVVLDEDDGGMCGVGMHALVHIF